jgi:multimeric flavodoxin WrbA
MKIMAISCSPRKQGNTDILLNQALDGAEVELFSVAGKNLSPCDACHPTSRHLMAHCTYMLSLTAEPD